MDIEITIRVPVPDGTTPVVRTAAESGLPVVGPPDIPPPATAGATGSAGGSAVGTSNGRATDAGAGAADVEWTHSPPAPEDFGLPGSGGPSSVPSADSGPPSPAMIAQVEAQAGRTGDGAPAAPPDVSQAPSWLDAAAGPPAVGDHPPD